MRRGLSIEEEKEESSGERGIKFWGRKQGKGKERKEKMRGREKEGKRQREGKGREERRGEKRQYESKNSFCSTAVPIVEMGTLKLLLKPGMVSAWSRARTRPLYNLSQTTSGPVLAHETLWMGHFLDSPERLVDCCLLELVEGYQLTSPTPHTQVECLGDAWAQEVPAGVCPRKNKPGMGISQCPPFLSSLARER